MIDPGVSRLAERNMLAAAPRLATAASHRLGIPCPTHPQLILDGGPIRFHCAAGHSLVAADLDHETHAPLRRVTS